MDELADALREKLFVSAPDAPRVCHGKTLCLDIKDNLEARRYRTGTKLAYGYTQDHYIATLMNLNEEVSRIFINAPGTLFGSFLAEIGDDPVTLEHSIMISFYIA